jgi:hypothetical protein
MYKKFEISIVTIVLEEVYADGVIEAYEREALKKVLKRVGIQREVFQKIHKQISIEAKKKTLEPCLNDQADFLQRVSNRLNESTNAAIAQQITTLLAEEFQLESPTPDVFVESSGAKRVPRSSIATKKKKALNSEGNLKITSPNYGLACYILGNGSLSWMFVFALIPILLNLNVQELYAQHKYFKKTATTTVQGTVLGSLFARNALFDSEIVEVHYHYIKDGKNFTGHSYTLDKYKNADQKVSVLVNNTNPKLSQLRDGSYYEYNIIIFIPLLALVFWLMSGIYGTLNALSTPLIELKMIGQDLNSILSHFAIRRFSIVLGSIIFCTFFSVGDIFFNTLVPIINMLVMIVIVVVAIVGAVSAES